MTKSFLNNAAAEIKRNRKSLASWEDERTARRIIQGEIHLISTLAKQSMGHDAFAKLEHQFLKDCGEDLM